MGHLAQHEPRKRVDSQNHGESLRTIVQGVDGDRPVHVLYSDVLARQARRFLKGFRGETLYAVKANPHPAVLKGLYDAGIRGFDVASQNELDAVMGLGSDVRVQYMHPIKSREAIRYAHARGVRTFALDDMAELKKIQAVCGDLVGMTLYVRFAVASGDAAYDLGGKFGVAGIEAIRLLQAVAETGASLGVTFHVGSECLRASAYRRAIQAAETLVQQAGVTVEHLDVGGGFPCAYPGMEIRPLTDYFMEIHTAVADSVFADCTLACEPGRALVAEAGSVLVRVELVRGLNLYLNEGTYGSLFDAGSSRWRFPVRLVNRRGARAQSEYRFFGPTCDSVDVMEGPFVLPSDIAEGDWIEVQNIGAYGMALQTRFNGFYSDALVNLKGAPKYVSIQNNNSSNSLAAE